MSRLLAILADAYMPAIALLLAYCLYLTYKESKRFFKGQLFLLTILLFVVYGFMFLDNIYKVWPKMGLDYSTHSALFFALSLCVYTIKSTFKYILGALLFSYFWMLIYLEYHTFLDILSTISVILLCYVFVVVLKKKYFLLVN